MKKIPIYYDTETTGIRAQSDRIIEIAAYDPVNKRSFESLINPQCPIPQEASAIHHITDDMVKDAPLFKEVGQQFIDFCGNNGVLIAHNNDAFDKPFLMYSFQRENIDFPDWQFIDSLKFSRKYRPDMPKHSLQHLRTYYGVEENNAHRALDDVMVLYQIFSIMIDDLDVECILDLMSEKHILRQMPFGKHQGKPLSAVPKGYLKWLQENGALDKPENKELKDGLVSLSLITV